MADIRICRIKSYLDAGQTEAVDKAIHPTNGITPLIEAFWHQRRLSAIGTFKEALHELPRQNRRIIADSSFSRSQDPKLKLDLSIDFRAGRASVAPARLPS
jgi:hypothetical protein